MPPPTAAGVKQPFGVVLKAAAYKALGGGTAGAIAMVVQVFALMWMRTTINFQHKYGMSTKQALRALYAQGGLARFYQGLTAALLQAPLSRFGDTAAHAGMMALLEHVDLPKWMKTLSASVSAALFRIGITPIDTLKTTLQVEGPSGLALLSKRVAEGGPLTLYSGSLGSSFATLVGHYPWFLTYEFLQQRVPAVSGPRAKQIRNALIGFVCAMTSDIVSNSVRVVKTAKQTAEKNMSYSATVAKIVAEGGLRGLFLRGLGTKIISNGVQAMLFTVIWRYVQELLEKRQAARRSRIKDEAGAAGEAADGSAKKQD
jgi:hypothetical protein